MKRLLLPALFLLLMAACTTSPYVPKPRAYYRVVLPQRGYQRFDDPRFPYSFEYPVYARILRDTLFFGHPAENPFWITIQFNDLGAGLYISYNQLTPAMPLQKRIEDTHEMSFFHTKKADYINDTVFHNSHGVIGDFFTVGGDAASAYQFFATDSIKHFLRGALYFDVTPNADSLRPMNEFLRTDLEHFIGTLRFKG